MRKLNGVDRLADIASFGAVVALVDGPFAESTVVFAGRYPVPISLLCR